MNVFQKNVRLFLLLTFIFSAIISSCKKDEDNNSNTVPSSGATVKTTVVGKILDDLNAVVSGVTVKLGNHTTITNEKGYFVFVNVDVSKERIVVKATKAGYFDAIYAKRSQIGDANYMNFTMQQKTSATNIPGVSGGVVNLFGGSKITFPSNAFIDANGNPYTGIVKVTTRHIRPQHNNFESMIPGGDLLGINLAGQPQSLYSFGMLEAILTDNSGLNEIKLAPGKTAELKFPIETFQSSAALATIPLWYLDEETGLWKEEGDATKSGNFYIGNVAHFSVWNCDYSGTRTDIRGKVVDCFNNPVQGIKVKINGFMNVMTDNNGNYATWVPAGYTIECQVLKTQNPQIFGNSQLESISAIAGILNIIPTLNVPCSALISGTVKTCGGASPVPALVFFSWNDGNNLIYTSTGNYQTQVCASAAINVIANSMNSEGSLIVMSGAQNTMTNVPDIQVCNPSTLAKTSFTINDNAGNSTYYVVTTVNGCSTGFVDSNNDGVIEQIDLFYNGIAEPGSVNVQIQMSLNNENSGVYSLLSGSNNTIRVKLNSTNYYGGLVSGNTLNRMIFTDYASAGGLATGKFEFNFNNGSITDGQIAIIREY